MSGMCIRRVVSSCACRTSQVIPVPWYHQRLYVLIATVVWSYIGKHQVAEEARPDQREGAQAQRVGEVRLAAYVGPGRPITREAIAAGDKAAAEEAYKLAAQKLDKAAGAGVIHKNQAANRKSGLARAINAL